MAEIMYLHGPAITTIELRIFSTQFGGFQIKLHIQRFALLVTFSLFFRPTKSSFIRRKIPHYGGSGIGDYRVELLTIEERMENDKYK
jgi:hypothetical protein